MRHLCWWCSDFFPVLKFSVIQEVDDPPTGRSRHSELDELVQKISGFIVLNVELKSTSRIIAWESR